MKKLLFLSAALLSVLALVFGITSCADDDDDDTEESVYALVNIPFKEFFASETSDGDFDAYSSATQKAANGSISYGTYHTQTEVKEATTQGITCPVKISKSSFEKLKNLGGNEITDSTASFDLTITGRGASTIRYSGKQNLFQSPDYSYYLLSEEPSYYKEASVSDTGATFSKIKGSTKDIGKIYVTIAAGEAHHYFSPAITLYTDDSKNEGKVIKLSFDNGDIAKTVTKDDEGNETLEDKTLGALKTIIATDSDGKSYGLTTLQNMFWGKSQIGFQAPESEDESKNLYPQHELVGKTIAKLTFVTETEIYTASNFTVGTVETDSETNLTTFTANEGEEAKFVIPNTQAK